MDPGSAGDDRPYFRPERRSYALPMSMVAIALAIAAGYYYFRQLEPPPPPAAPSEQQRSSAPQPSAAPAAGDPLELPAVTVPGLPALENSDVMMRDSLAALMGRAPFDELVIPVELVRRIVATVDNLPRRTTVPRRIMPLNPVPGRFAVSGEDGAETIAPANFTRYAPYARVAEAVDAGALVAAYVRAYPLFQRAYEQLGYPGKHFNTRLVQAIDDLLLAPERAQPARLVRGRVLYEFADPDLETRSAGQKIMIRMGTANAARVKAKLVEIRRELALAAASRREGERRPGS